MRHNKVIVLRYAAVSSHVHVANNVGLFMISRANRYTHAYDHIHVF